MAKFTWRTSLVTFASSDFAREIFGPSWRSSPGSRKMVQRRLSDSDNARIVRNVVPSKHSCTKHFDRLKENNVFSYFILLVEISANIGFDIQSSNPYFFFLGPYTWHNGHYGFVISTTKFVLLLLLQFGFFPKLRIVQGVRKPIDNNNNDIGFKVNHKGRRSLGSSHTSQKNVCEGGYMSVC